MNTMTARGLSLAVVVAVWTAISHTQNLPLSLWPVLVGLGCFLAAGGGIPGLQKSVAGVVSGVVWALVYAGVSRALGRQDIVDALVLGAAAFGMVLQTRVPLLSFTAGAFAGAGTALGMGARTVQGGIRVAIVLAIGVGLGYAADWLAGKIRTRTARGTHEPSWTSRTLIPAPPPGGCSRPASASSSGSFWICAQGRG